MFKLSGHCVVKFDRADFEAKLLDDEFLYGKLIGPKGCEFVRVHHWQSAGHEKLEALPEEPVKHVVRLKVPPEAWWSCLMELVAEVTSFSELDEIKQSASAKAHGESPRTFKYDQKWLEEFSQQVTEGHAPYERLCFDAYLRRILAEWTKFLTAKDNPWPELDPEVSQKLVALSTFDGSKKELCQASKDLGLEIVTSDLNFVTHRRKGMISLAEVAVQLMSQLNQPQ